MVARRFAGQFDRITDNCQIAMAWEWQEPDPMAEIPMHVAFDLSPMDFGIRVTVTHRGIPSDAACTIHQDGWQTTLARLARQLGG